MIRKLGLVFIFGFFITLLPITSFAFVKGIYLTQHTAENTKKVNYLIRNAKSVGITTFVVDYYRSSKRYRKNIELIKKSGIRYVARIVVFPYGGTQHQVSSMSYLHKRLKQIQQAIVLGADEIQLDYIRFKPSQAPSHKNAQRIAEVIRYFKQHIKPSGVKLQVDVFGVSSFKPSIYIGQDVGLFAKQVDAICPMVYPSHYEPYLEHARTPYKTVFTSIQALKKQITQNPKVKVYAYIELFNYRYPMSRASRKEYIKAQLRAVRDSGADGWYAWSAKNYYDILFNVLRK